MVYGNMGNNSATGVAFSRDAANGRKHLQRRIPHQRSGRSVVAGIRTPQQITIEGSKRWAPPGHQRRRRAAKYPRSEESMPYMR